TATATAAALLGRCAVLASVFACGDGTGLGGLRIIDGDCSDSSHDAGLQQVFVGRSALLAHLLGTLADLFAAITALVAPAPAPAFRTLAPFRAFGAFGTVGALSALGARTLRPVAAFRALATFGAYAATGRLRRIAVTVATLAAAPAAAIAATAFAAALAAGTRLALRCFLDTRNGGRRGLGFTRAEPAHDAGEQALRCRCSRRGSECGLGLGRRHRRGL